MNGKVECAMLLGSIHGLLTAISYVTEGSLQTTIIAQIMID